MKTTRLALAAVLGVTLILTGCGANSTGTTDGETLGTPDITQAPDRSSTGTSPGSGGAAAGSAKPPGRPEPGTSSGTDSHMAPSVPADGGARVPKPGPATTPVTAPVTRPGDDPGGTHSTVPDSQADVTRATLLEWQLAWRSRDGLRDHVIAEGTSAVCTVVDQGWILLSGLRDKTVPDVMALGAYNAPRRPKIPCSLDTALVVVDIDSQIVTKGPTLFSQMLSARPAPAQHPRQTRRNHRTNPKESRHG